VLLLVSAACAVGFGNVVNDIRDIATDRVNHPRRPLPAGDMSVRAAIVFACALAGAALAGAALVSPAHAAGCIIPLALLLTYAFALKATALAGNVVVSLLVAYPLLYGALGAPRFSHVLVPAFLAFLLNFCREIVKDIEDRRGDALEGLTTTASLPAGVLKAMLVWLAIVYALNMFVPLPLGHFGLPYAAVCALLVLPLHIGWLVLLLKKGETALSRVSLLMKWEMLGGMLAVAADNFIKSFLV